MPQDFQAEPREGELYRVVQTYGHTFELRYGYYEECDRSGPPDVLYPNLIEEPRYSQEGYPLATRMQDACPYFLSKQKRRADPICGECRYFCPGEDWFGICTKRRRE